jgi:hypothetical protein
MTQMIEYNESMTANCTGTLVLHHLQNGRVLNCVERFLEV